MPLLIDGIYSGSKLWRKLKELKIKKQTVKSVYHANGKTLVFLKDERICEKFPELIPEEKEVKEIVEVHKYVERFLKLIELEREAEISAQLEEIKRLSGRERELVGRAVLDLKGVKAGERFGFYMVRFLRDKEIKTEISPGDVVLVSKGNPLTSDLLATVSKVGERAITVAFDNPPPSWVFKRGVRLDLYVNDTTFKRMEENLSLFRHPPEDKRTLRNIIVGIERAETELEEVKFVPFNERLNDSQKRAISLALSSKNFYLIHGPPGTGKTVTLTELILQFVKMGLKVLATADSNVAVDNLLANLSKYGIKVVRIGHPARILDELEGFSIFAQLEKLPEYQEIRTGWEEVRELIKKRDSFTKPVPQLRRGLSDAEIVLLGRKRKGKRGVDGKTMESMANWLIVNHEIGLKVKRLKSLEEKLLAGILKSAQVVVSTNSMVGSELMLPLEFDVAVIDEGSQQVEPSTLIPIMKAKRFFIAGDHKQLPPTVASLEAKELEKTLFERLIKDYPELSSMLTIQYRMNRKIMEFPNREFYQGKLVPAPEVENWTLKTLGVSNPKKFKELLDPEVPIGFLDTSGINAVEFQPSGSTSYENYEEAKIVVEIVKELLNMGLKEKDVGVITPYALQVKTLKELLEGEGISVEVNSVDGFQGREKEAIVISFVRSNDKKDIGFLKDYRRLNVAITRAKKKLICVGNVKTLEVDPVYRRFIEYLKENGKILNL